MNPVILEAIPLQAILLAQDRAYAKKSVHQQSCVQDRSIVSQYFQLKSRVCEAVALDGKVTCDGRKP